MTNPDGIRGAIYGALCGDALGVPYEFHDANALPAPAFLEMTPPAEFRRAHSGTPPGTWSDDGAQLLALMDSLSKNTEFDLQDFASRLLRWLRTGQYAVDARVFDCGIQTQYGLDAYESGVDPRESGPATEQQNGNGALMRVLPVAFLAVDDAETIRIAKMQGLPTHGHVRSQITCALYALLAKRLLAGMPFGDARQSAEATLRRFESSEWAQEVALLIDGRQLGRGSGYVLDCYWSALDALESTESFEDCVKKAIALGNDTDTTACVAAGLAGALYGYKAIPERWLLALRAKDVVEQMLSAYIG